MKKSKLMLLAAGALLLVLGVCLFAFAPAQNTYIKTAVVLDEPVVLPENDGKLVLLHGKPEMTKAAYDAAYGLTLETPLAIRHDQVYHASYINEALTWTWTTEKSEAVLGSVKLGDFELDAAIVRLFPAVDPYSNFSSKEAIWYNLPQVDGNTYVVQKGTDYYPTTTDRSAGQPNEGAKAAYYLCCDLSQISEMTILGVQSGSRLLLSDAGDATVNSGAVSWETLVGGMPAGTRIAAVLSLLAGAAFLAAALWKKRSAPAAE